MKRRKTFFISLMLGLVVVIFSGCGSTYSSQPATAVSEKNTVIIQGYSFNPAELTIQKGEIVTWVNHDSVGHTITGTSFTSGILEKGDSFQQTFKETGTFEYHCSPHPGMKGKIIVQ